MHQSNKLHQLEPVLCFVGLLVGWAPALAEPPPPPTAASAQSSNAMDGLSQFLGAWEGDESVVVDNRSYKISLYRQFIRPSNTDYIMLVEYKGDTVFDFSLLTYDTVAKGLQFVVPGPANLVSTPSGVQVIPVERPGPYVLTWRRQEQGLDGQELTRERRFEVFKGGIRETSTLITNSHLHILAFDTILHHSSRPRWIIR